MNNTENKLINLFQFLGQFSLTLHNTYLLDSMISLVTVVLDLSLPFRIAQWKVPTSKTNKFRERVASSFLLALNTSMTWFFLFGNFLSANHVLPMCRFREKDKFVLYTCLGLYCGDESDRCWRCFWACLPFILCVLRATSGDSRLLAPKVPTVSLWLFTSALRHSLRIRIP
jgi:uncharacterized membrane protein